MITDRARGAIQSGAKRVEEIIDKYGDIETFLDDKITEEDAEFAEVIGETKGIEATILDEEIVGRLVLNHGYKEDDYIITIAPIKGKFKIADEQVIKAMIIMLDKYLPRTLQVTLLPPGKDWEIQEFAVKIKDAKLAWQLSDDMLKNTAISVATELTKHA